VLGFRFEKYVIIELLGLVSDGWRASRQKGESVEEKAEE